jgi:hypothetical protein
MEAYIVYITLSSVIALPCEYVRVPKRAYISFHLDSHLHCSAIEMVAECLRTIQRPYDLCSSLSFPIETEAIELVIEAYNLQANIHAEVLTRRGVSTVWKVWRQH